MRLLLLKWWYKLLIRRDEFRKNRLMERWPIERAWLDTQFVREIRAVNGAIQHSNQMLTEIEQERLWERANQHG